MAATPPTGAVLSRLLRGPQKELLLREEGILLPGKAVDLLATVPAALPFRRALQCCCFLLRLVDHLFEQDPNSNHRTLQCGNRAVRDRLGYFREAFLAEPTSRNVACTPTRSFARKSHAMRFLTGATSIFKNWCCNVYFEPRKSPDFEPTDVMAKYVSKETLLKHLGVLGL